MRYRHRNAENGREKDGEEHGATGEECLRTLIEHLTGERKFRTQIPISPVGISIQNVSWGLLGNV